MNKAKSFDRLNLLVAATACLISVGAVAFSYLAVRNTSLSVTEICFASGFNSLAHFVATFTKRYKMSPSQARA
jgi:AraC-like DNA-binding protein